jgi:hypothetical protein
MRLGADKHGVYILGHNGGNDLRQAGNCHVIPKADAIAAGGPDLSRMQVFENLTYPVATEVDLDANKAADAPYALLNFDCYSGPTCDSIDMYRITWNEGKASISERQRIKLSRTYLTPNGQSHLMECTQPPPGNKLRADGGRRTESLFAFNGSVFGANCAKVTADGRVGILWYEIRVSDGKVLQEGYFEDPKADYLFPALAVDAKGNVGIGCTRTSETEFPSVVVMMHGAGDAPATMGRAAVAIKGTTAYRYNGVQAVNWSNYASACRDPVDPGLIWTYQGFAGSDVDRQWCAGWACFRAADAGK